MENLHYQQLTSEPELKSLVPHFWSGSYFNPQEKTFTHISTAQSKAEIIFHLEGDFWDGNVGTQRTAKAGIYGQCTTPNRYSSSSKSAKIFGICLESYALPILFTIPAHELSDIKTDLSAIMGSIAIELWEKIFLAKTDEERVSIISHYFIKKLNAVNDKFKRIEYVLKYIQSMSGLADIKQLKELSCLSSRQFERNFKEFTGFPVQTYLRIVRFENAVRKLSDQNKKLTDLAFECGYFDQAHFNREFKLLSGFSPGNYAMSNEVAAV